MSRRQQRPLKIANTFPLGNGAAEFSKEMCTWSSWSRCCQHPKQVSKNSHSLLTTKKKRQHDVQNCVLHSCRVALNLKTYRHSSFRCVKRIPWAKSLLIPCFCQLCSSGLRDFRDRSARLAQLQMVPMHQGRICSVFFFFMYRDGHTSIYNAVHVALLVIVQTAVFSTCCWTGARETRLVHKKETLLWFSCVRYDDALLALDPGAPYPLADSTWSTST